MTTYQPKGGMCTSCAKKYQDCSHLDFKSMPQLVNTPATVIVRCTEYKRGSRANG